MNRITIGPTSARIWICTGDDSERNRMLGTVRFEYRAPGSVWAVAANGFCIAVVTYEYSGEPFEPLHLPSAFVARVGQAVTASRLPVVMFFADRKVEFRDEHGWVISTESIDGTYPDWRSIFRKFKPASSGGVAGVAVDPVLLNKCVVALGASPTMARMTFSDDPNGPVFISIGQKFEHTGQAALLMPMHTAHDGSAVLSGLLAALGPEPVAVGEEGKKG